MARQGGISLLCAAVAFWVGYAVGGQKRRRARKAPKQVATPPGWTHHPAPVDEPLLSSNLHFIWSRLG